MAAILCYVAGFYMQFLEVTEWILECILGIRLTRDTRMIHLVR